MALRAVRHGELAGGQPGGLVEHVEQRLAVYLTTGCSRFVEDRKRDAFSEGKLAPGDTFNALAAFVGGSGHSLSLWARAAVEHHRRWQRDPARIHSRHQLQLARRPIVS